ncbi:GntR family transcriptional regulator [Paenactinomyces guangxiensis]|uniref:GntR family transcriptional regulator n=1 Tax=Paenactinomyces guangxiensis TaxID=1490290 RepID=A0A7W2A8L7_9BACL|nr:GntR family transcriptional regulator [Paenactinomyces guangxiensis]MBA4494314.1 GntR family transcriptional regulator [Paenactinomyces guangxiensis]MBH8590808.1 GntR family transcriptional regulator [Paenactinomyces guangxiensis]
MPKNNKWQDIYYILRDRIHQGELRPWQEFPTNFELMKEFEAHAATVQNAVNALIGDGLVFSAGNTTQRRRVRPLPSRSHRRGDFIAEHGGNSKEVLIKCKILDHMEDIPEAIQGQITLPALFHHTLQLRDDIIVAVSRSYIPDTVPLEPLKELLEQPNADIYETMKSHGLNPSDCEETLICSIASPSEMEELQMPEKSRIPIVRITRKVFDPDGKLLLVCLMVDRADCFEFQYRFPLC